MQTAIEPEFRQVLLSVLLTSLIVTSGCTGLLPGDMNEAETGTPVPETRTNGTDLRSLSIPENGSITASGELDHGDPKHGSNFYEPVQVDAPEGQVVRITMKAESRNPSLRVVSPDGNVTQNVSNESGNVTVVPSRELLQSGNYTLETTSTDQNATFNYTLTIERVERNDKLFAGDAAQWNETEQYLNFGQDVSKLMEGSSPPGQYPTNASKNGLRANATGDYLIITYKLYPHFKFAEKNKIDVSFMLEYQQLVGIYKKFRNNSITPADETWAPEIIFFKGVSNETGEIVRTTFLTKEWARAYLENDTNEQFDSYLGWYYSTIRQGPGSPEYDPEDGITNDEFPQAYHNYTYPGDNSTLAERYGL